MKRWAPVIVIALILTILPVTYIQGGPGSRVMDLAVDEILIDGLQSPSGAYSAGDHDIGAQVTNTGSEVVFGYLYYRVVIRYSNNQTTVLNETGSRVVSFDPGQSAEVPITQFEFPEGDMDITVNGTFSKGEFFKQESFLFENHDDMELLGSNLQDGQHYPPDTSFQLLAILKYSTNFPQWTESLQVRMSIFYQETVGNEVYNKTVGYVMEGDPDQYYSGHPFNVSFPEWTPSGYGLHRLVVDVLYEDKNLSNNMIDIEFSIVVGPPITGYVQDVHGQPLEGVKVELHQVGVYRASMLTDENGTYEWIEIPLGDYEFSFEKEWYLPASGSLSINSTDKQYLNITMTPLGAGGIKGFVKNDDGAPVKGATIYLENENRAVLSTPSGADGSYSFDNVSPGAYLIWSISDIFGPTNKKLRSVFGQEWTIHDITLIEYLITVKFDPLSGRDDVKMDEYIFVRFSEPMDFLTFTDENFTFRVKGMEEPIMIYIERILMEGDDSFNSSFIVLPYDWYNYNTTYELVLGSELMSENGLPLGREIKLTFTTVPFLTDLVVSSHYPEPEMENIPPDVTIHATFPQPMNPATINSSTIMIVDGGGNSILADITYSDSQRTIYIQPVDELIRGEYYIVYLSSEIETLIPGYRVSQFSWSFQVAEEVVYGSLIGRLVDEDGEPFDQEDVRIRLVHVEDKMRIPILYENGSFEVRDLETGIWRIEFYVYGYKDYRVNELVEEDRTTYLGTVTLYEDGSTTTTNGDFNYRFIGGTCCIVTLLIIIIVLSISNMELKNDKKKNTKLVKKLENLLDNPLEE